MAPPSSFQRDGSPPRIRRGCSCSHLFAILEQLSLREGWRLPGKARGKIFTEAGMSGELPNLQVMEKSNRRLPRVVAQHSHRQGLRRGALDHSLCLEPADQAACPSECGLFFLPRSSSGLRVHSCSKLQLIALRSLGDGKHRAMDSPPTNIAFSLTLPASQST